MTTPDLQIALLRMRVWIARAHQLIGWAGVSGVALLLVASAIVALAVPTKKEFQKVQASRWPADLGPESATALPGAATISAMGLPAASEIPLLLTQIEYAATGNGLDWRAADYRVVAATPTQPASLEIHCTLKGPYPKLRGMLVQLIRAIPGFSVREFAMSRPAVDVSDLDAKLVLAVILQDSGAVGSDPSAKSFP